MSAAPDMAERIVCFGEILLRLAAPPGQPPGAATVDAGTGGAEANVAVALALLGHRAAMVSVLPDNALGRAAFESLSDHGVDTSGIRLQPGRMGLYFLESGAAARPADIIYDRAGSAYALADPDLYDWPALLDGAAWLHASGIAPAVGDGPAQAVLAAMCTARAACASRSTARTTRRSGRNGAGTARRRCWTPCARRTSCSPARATSPSSWDAPNSPIRHAKPTWHAPHSPHSRIWRSSPGRGRSGTAPANTS